MKELKKLKAIYNPSEGPMQWWHDALKNAEDMAFMLQRVYTVLREEHEDIGCDDCEEMNLLRAIEEQFG